MKSLLRILLNAATVLSLMLCVASVALWVRGHWVTETFGGSTGDGGNKVAIQLLGRGVEFSRSRWPGWAGYPTPWKRYTQRRGQLDPDSDAIAPPGTYSFRAWSWPALSIRHLPPDPINPTGWWVECLVPFWLLCIATAFLPTARMVRAFRGRRGQDPRFCAKCG